MQYKTSHPSYKVGRRYDSKTKKATDDYWQEASMKTYTSRKGGRHGQALRCIIVVAYYQ